MRKAFLIVCCWMTGVLSAPAQRAGKDATKLPETNLYTSASDVEAGRRMYAGRCGHCHGQNGEGGRGATLNTGRFRHAGSGRELFLVVRDGIPGTEMPGAFRNSDAEIWRIVAYVQQLSRHGAPDPVSGDPSAGAIVYRRNGCGQCHSIDGQGGFLGPDLTDIGAKRAARHLRESVLDPDSDITLEYRTVEVTAATGKSARGIHLNEDEYSVHLRDMSGNLRSFMKSELENLKLPRQSLMPAYTTLSKTDVENLVAYLSSLK